MRLRFIVSETAKGLVRNLAMTVSVVLVAFVSLLFVGASGLLQMQISAMRGEWYDEVEVSVYMCPQVSAMPACVDGEATQQQIDAVEDRLKGSLASYVETYHIETKAQAYQNFMSSYGDSAVGRNATEDMMPVSFRIKLVDPENYEVVAEQFEGQDGVDRVMDQEATLEPLFLVMNRASWITGGLAAIMAVAAVLLITTTIRLSALSRSRETGIMRLVGASNLFIQLPFILEGVVAALAGALLAVGTLWIGVRYIVEGWLATSMTFITAFIGTSAVLSLAPWLVLAAVALAALSSAYSLSKYTRV